MKKPRVSKLACAIIALTIPVSAQASDGTITFSGAVTGSTCTVKLNGGTASGTVTLPTVSTAALDAAGKTAGATAFTLDISGCAFSGSDAAVTAYFEAGANVDATTGRLNNTLGAGNVQLQLFVGGNYASKIAAGQFGQNIATPVSSGQLKYGVEYYANGAAVTAGTVGSTVTYSLVYS